MPVQAVRTGVSLNYEVSEVAVTGGPGDAVVAGQRGDVAPVAEPAQSQYGLVEAGQGPAVTAGAALAAFGGQQPGFEVDGVAQRKALRAQEPRA